MSNFGTSLLCRAGVKPAAGSGSCWDGHAGTESGCVRLPQNNHLIPEDWRAAGFKADGFPKNCSRFSTNGSRMTSSIETEYESALSEARDGKTMQVLVKLLLPVTLRCRYRGWICPRPSPWCRFPSPALLAGERKGNQAPYRC